MKKSFLLFALAFSAASTEKESAFESEMSNKGTVDPKLDVNCSEANQNSCYYTSGVWDHYQCICLYPKEMPTSQAEQNEVGFEQIIVINDPRLPSINKFAEQDFETQSESTGKIDPLSYKFEGKHKYNSFAKQYEQEAVRLLDMTDLVTEHEENLMYLSPEGY